MYSVLYFLHSELKRFAPRDTIRIQKDEGSAAVLACNPPEGSPPPEFYWTIQEPNKAPIPVTLSDRVNLDNKTGDLIFANVLLNDSANYICNAKNTDRGFEVSDPTQLIVRKYTVSFKIQW